MRVGLVTFAGLPALDPDDGPLVAALSARGHEAQPLVWDDAEVDWGALDMAVLRSTWDYHHRRDEFLGWAEAAATRTALWNPAPVVRWNSDKAYLLELAARGAPVVPTVVLPAGRPASLAGVLADSGWSEVVVKPAVSADSFATVRASTATLAAGQAHLDALLGTRDMMVQPYFGSVEREGERCLVHLGGAFSHAVRKRSAFLGGRHAGPEGVAVRPAPDELDVAARVLEAAGARGLPYARVDLARDGAGRPCLMELELVEPTLFFREAEGSAERLVRALEDRAP